MIYFSIYRFWSKTYFGYQKALIQNFTPKFLLRNFTPDFYYEITFVNSQCKNTNSKGGFVLKNRFEMFDLKFSGNKNYSLSSF